MTSDVSIEEEARKRLLLVLKEGAPVSGASYRNKSRIRRFKYFPEDRSVFDEVRRAMALHPHHKVKAADAIGLDKNVYSFLVRLVILEKKNLPQASLDVIARAMAMVEEKRSIKDATVLVAETIDQHWQVRKERPTLVSKKHRRLEQSLIHIGESCQATADMELPRDLSQKEVREAIATLSTSIEQIGRLIRRLVGEDQ